MLKDKKILLGITGSIAAYKSLLLTRLLVKNGCEVKVIMTDAAKDFVSPLSFSTLSKNEVYGDIFEGNNWNNHVELGLWADLMIIAPATANSLAKMANGICDNILMASYLSAKCPVFFAPAMDLDMWLHPSTQSNIETLEKYGNLLIDAEYGELASGLVGKGRMAEPEQIVSTIEKYFSKKKDLTNKSILITAGPTQEAIDPVRYIGNRSTGRMGIAIANECKSRGAEVNLVLGPSTLQSMIKNGIQIHKITSAQEMYDISSNLQSDSDVMIFAAAVADYAPVNTADQKIKKKENNLNIELKKTIDIADTLGKQKKKGQISVGFALETNNEIQNAIAKVEKKNFDFLVLNSLRDEGAGFGHTTNKVSFILKNGKIVEFPLKSKTRVAEDIVNQLVSLF